LPIIGCPNTLTRFLKEIFMTNAMCEPMPTLFMNTAEPMELNERMQGQLVRGEEMNLLARMEPLVREHSVLLDLASVERIDAAGITALLVLYHSARESGHRFNVTNVPERVAKTLAVVGLDGILLSHNAVHHSDCGQHVQ
jgi:anti-anti-sigma factor